MQLGKFKNLVVAIVFLSVVSPIAMAGVRGRSSTLAQTTIQKSLAIAKSVKDRDLGRQHSINGKNLKNRNPQKYILIMLGAGYSVEQS